MFYFTYTYTNKSFIGIYGSMKTRDIPGTSPFHKRFFTVEKGVLVYENVLHMKENGCFKNCSLRGF